MPTPPISSGKVFKSADDMAEEIRDKFRYPENFFRTNDGIKAVPFKPVSKDMER